MEKVDSDVESEGASLRDENGYESEDSAEAPPPYLGDNNTTGQSTASSEHSYPPDKRLASTHASSIRTDSIHNDSTRTDSIALTEASSSSTADDRTYSLYYPRVSSRALVIVHDATKTPTFYAEISEFRRKIPDVRLHAFPTPIPPHANHVQLMEHGRGGPVIGVAHFPHFSRDLRVSLGDPAEGGEVEWIDVLNPNTIHHGEYRFAARGIRFAWRRTRDPAMGVKGNWLTRAMNMDSYVLSRESTGEKVAVFVDDKWGKQLLRGTLRLFKDLDSWVPVADKDRSGEAMFAKEEMMQLIFMTATGILDKARRRRNARHRRVTTGAG